MRKTVTLRLDEANLAELRRGRSVWVRVDPQHLLGRRKRRRPGRPPGPSLHDGQAWWQIGGRPRPGSHAARLLLWAVEHGGRVDTRQTVRLLGIERVHATTVLSALRKGGLLRREFKGRYAVTARGMAACPSLRDDGRYLRGSNRERLLEWAVRRGKPFENRDVSRLLGVGPGGVAIALRKLLEDRFVRRVSFGVYEATARAKRS